MLIGKHKTFTIPDLADEFQVSSRTIYNDIAKLNELLGSQTSPIIKMEKGQVFIAEKVPMEISRRLSDSFYVQSNKESRKTRIKCLILLSKDFFSTEEILENTLISKNTLISDLKSIKNELKEEHINLISVPFKGYKVEGNESKIRNVLALALREDMFFIESEDSRNDKESLGKIAEILNKYCSEVNISFSDECFERMVLLFWIAKERIKLNKNISEVDIRENFGLEESFLRKEREYLNRIFEINVSESELLYLANKLSTASVVRYKEFMSEKWLSFNLITERFIIEVEKNFVSNEFRYDKVLFEGLMNHLKPAYGRGLFDEWIENPMYDEITSGFSRLHLAVTKSIFILEDELKVFFTPHEISFFTMFFAASLEKNKRRIKGRKRVIIICNAGVSTSEIIKSQISGRYDVDILGVFNEKDGLDYLLYNEVDVVVTTLSLDLEELPVIQVNPFLTEKNLIELSTALPHIFSEVKIEKIMEIIKNYTDLNMKEEVKIAEEISSYLAIPTGKKKVSDTEQPSLKDIVKEALILVNYEAKDKEEAIRKSGELLVENNKATKNYVSGMLANATLVGQYFVIAPGVAMPHARTEEGALDVGISIVRLKTPIAFGHPVNDPISIVIGFCAIDHQKHLKVLADVRELLIDEARVKRLFEAEEVEDVMEIIRSK
jgi:transcriptional antiterminator/mannitol/fructose-specific phosphotransferase system IIA component (Ntr-type)